METVVLEQKLQQLSPRHQEEVARIIEQLLKIEQTARKRKFRFDWEGALENMNTQYTSVELQHSISKLWRQSVSR